MRAMGPMLAQYGRLARAVAATAVELSHGNADGGGLLLQRGHIGSGCAGGGWWRSGRQPRLRQGDDGLGRWRRWLAMVQCCLKVTLDVERALRESQHESHALSLIGDTRGDGAGNVDCADTTPNEKRCNHPVDR